LAKEHDRAHEVRITQLRHREEQGGSEGGGGIHGRMVAVARRLVNPTHLGARPLLARSRALRCSDAPSSTPARLAPRAAWRLSAPASALWKSMSTSARR